MIETIRRAAKLAGMKSFRYKGQEYPVDNNYGTGGSLDLASLGNSVGTLVDVLGTNPDGTKSPYTSAVSGVVKGAAAGAMLGPIGAGAGAIIGGGLSLIQSNKTNEAAKESAKRIVNIKNSLNGQRSDDANKIQESASKPTTYFAKGGSMRRFAGGGAIVPVTPSVDVAVGDKHTAPSGGINVGANKVEGGEVIKDGNNVLSDQLTLPNGQTFAETARNIVSTPSYKKLEKFLNKQQAIVDDRFGEQYRKGTAERKIEKNPNPIDALFAMQEAMKQQMQSQESPQEETAEGVNHNLQEEAREFGPGGTMNNTDPTKIGRINKLRSLFASNSNSPQDTSINSKPVNADTIPFKTEQKKPYDWQGLGNSASKFLPYVDNAVNTVLNAKTPQVPLPVMNEGVNLQTKVNVDAQMNNINRKASLRNKFIGDNTNNSAVARANIAAGTASDIDQSNQILGNKINAETDLVNKQVVANAETNNQNVAKVNGYNAANYERSLGIQARTSANAANAAEDAMQQRAEKLMQTRDNQALVLTAMKYQQSGVLERSHFGEVLSMLEKGASPEEAFNYLEKVKKAKTEGKATPVTMKPIINSNYKNIPFSYNKFLKEKTLDSIYDDVNGGVTT